MDVQVWYFIREIICAYKLCMLGEDKYCAKMASQHDIAIWHQLNIRLERANNKKCYFSCNLKYIQMA